MTKKGRRRQNGQKSGQIWYFIVEVSRELFKVFQHINKVLATLKYTLSASEQSDSGLDDSLETNKEADKDENKEENNQEHATPDINNTHQVDHLLDYPSGT